MSNGIHLSLLEDNLILFFRIKPYLLCELCEKLILFLDNHVIFDIARSSRDVGAL
jgi:hypothetical protein